MNKPPAAPLYEQMASDLGMPLAYLMLPLAFVFFVAAVASFPHCERFVSRIGRACRRSILGGIGFGILATVFLTAFWLCLGTVVLAIVLGVGWVGLEFLQSLTPWAYSLALGFWEWAEAQPTWLQVFLGLAAFFVGLPGALFLVAMGAASVSALLQAIAETLEPTAQSINRLRLAFLPVDRGTEGCSEDRNGK